ncbi:nuclear intron maturase 2, mitochondrial-like [Selaginella moellendorffii]|uniref:nuclear intron maturase 2, mitochondrial-like n=1 Tax=Selaginella moellendorffii TaxID=88036 RepID=UPI000D1CC08E|nr:nuclear intron maturase 2, mitochondrial-like [Selaginella moellendorffii]|eukprot:XP_024545276.1 nuclear intron maturase 2, mitochondrial-like [Selaginella moellendorffii]
MESKVLWEMAYWRSCRALDFFVPKNRPLHPKLAAQLDPLREAVLSQRYDWGGTGTLYLTPAFLSPTKLPELQDRVVQEVLLMILEPVFEARFSHRSFAFRPGRTAMTALKYITGSFQECTWFITAKTSILESLELEVAMEIFSRVVQDELIVKLVRDGLSVETRDTIVPEEYFLSKKKKWRVMEQEIHRLTREKDRPFWLKCFLAMGPIEGKNSPHWGSCKILSPLLLNIVLDELDRFVEREIEEFDAAQGQGQAMEYVRYAGHFLLGIKGADEEIVAMEAKLREFCRDKLKLELFPEIFHLSQKVPFLAHTIQASADAALEHRIPRSRENSREVSKQKIRLVASMKHCVESLARLKILELPAGQRMKIHPCLRLLKARQEDANLQVSDLLHLLAGFYRLAINRKKITVFLAFVLRSSLAIMYASKHRLQRRAPVYKLGGDDLSWKIKGKKGVFEYARRIKPLPDEIVGIPFRHSCQVLPPLFLPVTKKWMPFHEICLERYIEGKRPGTLEKETERYRNASIDLHKGLIDLMFEFNCRKPLSEILQRCNDT